jgi:hypothetical protein
MVREFQDEEMERQRRGGYIWKIRLKTKSAKSET